MSPNYRKAFIITIILACIVFMYHLYTSNYIKVVDDAISMIRNRLPSYLIFSLLIERFVNGFSIQKETADLIANKSNLDYQKNKLEFLQSQSITNKDLSDDCKTHLNQIEQLEKKVNEKISNVATLKSKRTEKFNKHSFFIGFVLALLGLQFFNGILELNNNASGISSYVLTIVIVFFSSILIGGGSSLFKEIMDTIKGI